MANIIDLKVEPDKLVSTANKITQAAANVRKDFKNLNKALQDTKRYWKGDAADVSRKLYLDEERNILEIIADLEKYPVDILKMAGQYKEAENKNVGLAGALKSNVIRN